MLSTTCDNVPRFITKNWIEVHDKSSNTEYRYILGKQIRLKISMLKSDLCDFNDTYIVVKGTITVTNPDNKAYEKNLAFENNVAFVSYI